MKRAIFAGLSFGLTSGVITTLGLLVGLSSATHSRIAVIGGVITIAFADALSDSLGIHISEEAGNKMNHKQIWHSTFAAFFSKFLLGLSFIIPLILFSLELATIIGIIYGAIILIFLSYFISKRNKTKTLNVILEHISIATLVIIISHFIGKLVNFLF
jgi:vacuolar iron transporter family protein